MTITLHHEKSTRNYELYKSSNPIASIYIPKEELGDNYGHAGGVPKSITVTVQFGTAPAATSRS